MLPQCNVQRIIVYPNYIDSTKTVAEGRCIPKDLGECRSQASLQAVSC